MNVYKVDFTTWSQNKNRYVVVLADSYNSAIKTLIDKQYNESRIHTIELIASTKSQGSNDECCKLIMESYTQ